MFLYEILNIFINITPLHFSVENEKVEIVKILVADNRVNVNIVRVLIFFFFFFIKFKITNIFFILKLAFYVIIKQAFE